MGIDWKTFRVKEFADVIGGGTPKTKVAEYWNGSIPWLTPKDLSNYTGRYVSKGERNISLKGLTNSSARILPPKSVLLTSRAPVGYLAIAKNELTTNQGFRSLVVKERFCPEFIYYLLLNNIEYLKRHASGSTFQELSGGTLNELEFVIPENTSEQRAIAHILGSLDDKIELNRRMNQTLEAMARAIFKSWFVDFDPVRAKAEGRPTGLPDNIAALFPDSFQDSELGEIPRGWAVKTISEVAEFAYGKALKASDRKPGDVPVFGSNGQVGLHNEALAKGPGIVIGRKGNPGIVTWSYEDFFPIDTTFYVKRTGIVASLNYLFYALKAQDLPSLSADSAVPGLNRSLAYMSKILVPHEDVLTAFDGKVDPLFQKIYENEKEAETLASLRDTLLPKLISGELRIKDTEKLLEDELE